MGVFLPLLATFAVLAGCTALVATLGRHRRHRHRQLGAPARAQLEQRIGDALAGLVDAALDLRERIDDALARAREMLTIERHLGLQLRRPLWRQIEDANFGHTLERLREQLVAWLARFEALSSTERQLVEQLDLDVEPILELAEATRSAFDLPESSAEALIDHATPLQASVARLERARACLVRFERELIDHRASGYR